MRRRGAIRDAVLWGAIAIAVAVALATLALLSDAGRRIELSSVDARIERTDRATPRELHEVAVLEIDDYTDGRLGRRWPYPRHMHARAVEALAAAGARVVVLDVQFLDPSESPRDDELLVDAIRRAESAGTQVVLSTASDPDRGGLPLPFEGIDARRGDPPGTRLQRSGASVGVSDAIVDIDGVVRRARTTFHYRDDRGRTSTYPSLSRAALVAADRPARTHGETIRMTWSAPREGVLSRNFADAVQGQTGALAPLAGRTVFVGATSQVLHDILRTPVDDAMPGVYVHLQAWLDQRAGTQLTAAPAWTGAVAAGTLALLAALLALGPLRGRILAWGPIAAVLPACWVVLAVAVFDRRGLLLPVVGPLIGGLAATVLLVAHEARHALGERRRVTSVFSRYLAPDVVRELLERDLLDVGPGGTRREVTVLFADVRGFTNLSAGTDPDALVAQLNDWFDEMVAAIDDAKGTVDKFLGDGLMAFFGAPGVQPDHAQRAASAARSMTERLDRLNERRRAAGLKPLAVGIGIASGEVVVGNIGSTRRLEYTAIGDAVNLASRLEGATKQLGVAVVMSAATAAALPPEDVEPLGAIEVRGLAEPVEVATLRGGPVPADAT